MSFFINCHPLHKEMQGDLRKYSNQWVEKYTFRRQFDTVSIYQNSGSRFIPGAYELPNHEVLDRFTIPDKYFFLEWALIPIGEQLIVVITSVPLLGPRICLLKLSLLQLTGVHCWLRLLMTPTPAPSSLCDTVWYEEHCPPRRNLLGQY